MHAPQDLAGYLKKETAMPEPADRAPVHLSRRERAALLAALRFYQDGLPGSSAEIPDAGIREIATDSGRLNPLAPEEIGALCERINLADDAAHHGLHRPAARGSRGATGCRGAGPAPVHRGADAGSPITHLLIDTSSSDSDDNGECDVALVPLAPDAVDDLLRYMDEVADLARADAGVYSLECWDATPSYFRINDRLDVVRDVRGRPAVDVLPGEPVLLTADPRFDPGDRQRVECQTVQVSRDTVWWTAYVKHTSIRIETAHVPRKVLQRIASRFPGEGRRFAQRPCRSARQALRRIHDVLYLDMKGSTSFYDADKQWDADTLTCIADIVARYIPRPVRPPET